METNNTPHWERETIEKIALAGIKEQKHSRRWNIFFKILFFLYITFIIVTLLIKSDSTPNYDILGNKVASGANEHIALIQLNGTIAADEESNAAYLNAILREAISDKAVKGVLLLANSPGGSPVQSSMIYKTIRQLKAKFHKPILTVVTDTCASGCYYIVSATDEIYADKSSIVGSIGVISQSFGYADAAKKLGLDPRTFTAGKNKDFMNPTRPMTESEIDFLKGLLDELHQNFIRAVKTGRGKRLTDNPELFSGLFWTGTKAKALGLIDGIATPAQVALKIGDYPVYDYSAKDPIEKVLQRFGVETKNAVSSGINRAMMPKSRIQFQ
ncbi:MAG: signal peptide peptidase SppA [Ostreibacterium sp.]